MSSVWQSLAVGGIVAAAAVYLVARAWRGRLRARSARRSNGSCHADCGCGGV